ncbi:DUF3108 domain-containing protein [Aquariibacter albus]|uniref:DUF3108 domain-containing protein n=1 Tax=Aquariibacter albus TaxID=2759899 RepID=A0A839HW31_9BURK|nr:DUF3108 domain-containing protein [Aquariibacter albus]MBB1162904.1 DUF3108 domain-containing protein [Aquariibacter albus]
MPPRPLSQRLLLLALAVLVLHLLVLRACAAQDEPPAVSPPPPDAPRAVQALQTPAPPAPPLAAPPAPPRPERPAFLPVAAASEPAPSAACPVEAARAASAPARAAAKPVAPKPAPRPAAPASAEAGGGDRPAAAAPAAGGAAEALPPTRIPPAIQWRYRLSRGGLVGEGSLRWAPGPQGYTLELRGELPLIGTVLTQVSRGGFDAAGLAPQRFTDRRLRRPEQAANFRREPGQPLQVSFSGPSAVHTLPPGSQDRLSVMVQIAALAAAWTQPPEAAFVLHVVGARGDLAEWHLRVLGEENLRLVGGETVRALKLLREPEDEHDTRAELWLDPAHGHLPIRIRLSDGRGDPLDLLRKTAEEPPATAP